MHSQALSEYFETPTPAAVAKWGKPTSRGAAWQLDKVSAANWPSVSVIAWALVASHACNAVPSWTY
jgi:hypothetical protein